jgi:hypothetical protein
LLTRFCPLGPAAAFPFLFEPVPGEVEGGGAAVSFCFALSRFSAAKRACAGDREFVADMLTLFGRDEETRKLKVQQEVESDVMPG